MFAVNQFKRLSMFFWQYQCAQFASGKRQSHFLRPNCLLSWINFSIVRSSLSEKRTKSFPKTKLSTQLDKFIYRDLITVWERPSDRLTTIPVTRHALLLPFNVEWTTVWCHKKEKNYLNKAFGTRIETTLLLNQSKLFVPDSAVCVSFDVKPSF